jgi:hypothetical protein
LISAAIRISEGWRQDPDLGKLETGSGSRKAGDWIRISEGWRLDLDLGRLETESGSRKAGDRIRISEGWRPDPDLGRLETGSGSRKTGDRDPDPSGSQRSQEPDPALDHVIQKCEKS